MPWQHGRYTRERYVCSEREIKTAEKKREREGDGDLFG